MTKIICLKCGSANTRFIEKAGIYYCKECDHEFSPFRPLIFAVVSEEAALDQQVMKICLVVVRGKC